MKSVSRLIAVAILIGLGVWIYTVMFPSPQAIIRKRLNKVAQLASFPSNEGNIARIANVERLGGYFADKVEVKLSGTGVDERTFNDRGELKQAALGARTAVSSISVEMADLSVEMDAGQESATAHFTLELKIGTERDLVVQEMKVGFKKINGEWLINKAESVQTLKR